MTRLLTLLLLTRVTAEWVEISQQHYRKPIRTHSAFATTEKSKYVEDSSKPWAYSNRTLTEYKWNKNPPRHIIGNVKRLQHIGNTVKATDIVKLEDDPDFDIDEVDYEVKPNYTPTRDTLDSHEHAKQKGMIERVTNVGNIKRVQLNNSPVKSPALHFNGDRQKDFVTRHENTDGNKFEHRKSTGPINRKFHVTNVEQSHGADRPGTYLDGEEESTFIEQVTFDTRSEQGYRNRSPTAKPTFVTETEEFSNYDSQWNRFQKITNSKSSEATENMNALTTDIIDTNENMVPQLTTKLAKSTTETTPRNNVHGNVNDFEAEPFADKVHELGALEKQSNVKFEDKDVKPNGNKFQLNEDLQVNKGEMESEKIEEVTVKEGETTNSTKKEKIRVNTMENLIKFIRVVADTISRNSRRSVGGKMQYLHELKNSILANIEERIEATWPDDDSANSRRRSRSAQASPRGHVQFPSSESALMTISFLTFAVFLIKLVLQVIQTYKQKAMMVAPLMVASGRKVFSNHEHH